MESHELKKAKVELLLNNPFFASLLLKLNTEETERVPTAAVDGKNLFVNPVFFQGLNLEERIGLLAHEVMHPALLHHTRREGRNPMLWNMACDYAINPILLDSGLKLPKGGLVDKRFSGKSADEIYRILEQEIPIVEVMVQWQAGDGFEGGCGDVMDFPDMNPNDPNDANVKMEEQSQVQRLIAANHIAKQAGKQPAGMRRLIDELLNPKVDWATELRRILSEKAYDDYTWVKPNRRFIRSGFYLPVLENERFGEITIMVDTSGSITQEQLTEYASELNTIQSITRNTIHVIYCDAAVQHVDSFDAQDDLEMEIHGGGGTDFVPPFKWITKNEVEPKLAIYFTDGYCDSFPEAPSYDTIWCVNGMDNFKPPFGEVIYLK